MKRLKNGLAFGFVLCFLAACVGGDKYVIKERFSNNPSVGVIYTPSQINKFPDNTKGGPQNKWKVPVPTEFESIAKNVIVSGLKSQWPNANIVYEPASTNQRKYDLVVWVNVGGTYLVSSIGKANNPSLQLKMRSTLSIFDPKTTKNLTSLTGAFMGEVVSSSASADSDSVFTSVIPPASLTKELETKVSQGLADYFKEVKAAKKK